MSLGSGIQDPGSRIWNKPNPDPGSRGQKGPNPGSRIRIRNTGFSSQPVYQVLSFSSVSNMSWFLVFWTAYENFWRQVIVYQLFHLFGIDTDRVGIRQNDADPTRSGSTTLENTFDNTRVDAYSLSFCADPDLAFHKNFTSDQRFDSEA